MLSFTNLEDRNKALNIYPFFWGENVFVDVTDRGRMDVSEVINGLSCLGEKNGDSRRKQITYLAVLICPSQHVISRVPPGSNIKTECFYREFERGRLPFGVNICPPALLISSPDHVVKGILPSLRAPYTADKASQFSNSLRRCS